MIKRTAVTDLRNDLIETGYDYISNDGYKLLIDNHVVENSSQANGCGKYCQKRYRKDDHF